MIFARAEGRLGNQLFFMSVLLGNRKKTERLIITGVDELVEAFPSMLSLFPRLLVIRKAIWKRRRVDVWLTTLLRRRVIGSLSAGQHASVLKRKKGLLPIYLLAPGFYQQNSLVSVEPVLALRDSLLNNVSEGHCRSLAEHGGAEFHSRCFVHVRRGDYLAFPSHEHSAALPITWFIQQIRAMVRIHPKMKFIVLTDDVEFCREQFKNVEALEVLDCDAATAFVEMSSCDAGILSPSSLSWWGARVASVNADGPFVAPRYWFWWRFGHWRDSTLRDSDFLTWESVLDGNDVSIDR